MTTPAELVAEPIVPQPPHSQARGTAGLVLSILGILSVIAPYLGLPLSIAAVVLSSQQKVSDRQAGEVGLSRTTVGRVTGIVGIVLNGIMGAVLLVVVIVMRLAR